MALVALLAASLARAGKPIDEERARPSPERDKAYRDIVALENRALAAGRDDALVAHGQAIRIAGTLARPRLLAVLFMRLGQTLEEGGKVQDSVIAYESGLKALKDEPGIDVEAELRSLKEVPKGFPVGGMAVPADLYSEPVARELGDAEADPVLPVRLLISAGRAYQRQPQPDPALNAYARALQRPEIVEAPQLRAHALANMGEIHRFLGDVHAAETALGEALRLLERHADPLDKRRALALLAGIHRDRGRFAEALAEYQEALALYRQAHDPRGEGRAQAGLGRLYLDLGRSADAQVAYRRAVELGEKERDKESLWHAYWGLGRAAQATGDLPGAAEFLRKSLGLIEDRRHDLRTDEGRVTFLETAQDVFDQLLTVHLEQAVSDPGRHGDALRVAEESRGRALSDLMDGQERRRLSRASRAANRERVRCQQQAQLQMGAHMVRHGQFRDPRAAGERPPAESSAATELMDVQGAKGSAIPRQKAGELNIAPQAASEFNSAAQLAPTAAPSEARPTTAPGGEGTADVVSPLADDPECRSKATAETQAVPPTPSPLARLVFHVLSDRTVVLAVLTDGSVHGHVARLGRAALASRVEQIRDALGVDKAPRSIDVEEGAGAEGQPAGDYRRALSDLYAELVAPVATLLPAGETVVVEPHGPLWLLPFAALLAPDGTWLGERWPLVYTPSAQILDEIRKEAVDSNADTRTALVVGNPTLPVASLAGDPRFRSDGLRARFEALPGAAEEAKRIAGLMPETRTTLLIGPRADLDTVRRQAGDYDIVHLASHAIASAGSPLDSFVALAPTTESDGRLTARHAMQLTLSADLVTLSACQTGLGKVAGEGVIGLSRAFLVAGARTVLVSQWSVSDEATAALMVAFYRGYLLEGQDKARALHRAMKEVRSLPSYEHPRYWAPFIAVGAES